MAKILVIDSSGSTRVPFLRGILTRSLHEAGLSFEDAYKLASTVRQELGDIPEVTSGDLRDKVVAHLKNDFDPRICESYENPSRAPATIMVTYDDAPATPFSRGQHSRCLESCGLSPEDATSATANIFEYLIEHEITELSSRELGRITYDSLQEQMGKDVAYRYMIWVDFTHSGRPLILLLGGTTGCGKSTLATEVAHRLGIVRTQSTDLLREVMRMMIPERLLPVLHTSSFAAWKALPVQTSTDFSDNLLADGYMNQAELLAVPCEAVVQRALRERVSLILEGIHVHPSLLDRIDKDTDAIVIPIMLAVLKQDQLRNRLSGRGLHAPQRGAKRHVSNFDAIWRLQAFLLSEADRAGVPIVTNDDKEKATNLVMGTIIDALAENSKASPKEVFGSR